MLEVEPDRSVTGVDHLARPTALIIGANLVDRIGSLACDTQGAEVGGLLAGAGSRCHAVVPIVNTIPATHSAYVPSLEAYRSELANIYELGLSPIGWFHSHWARGHRPSPADRRGSPPRTFQLIVSVVRRSHRSTAAWWVDERREWHSVRIVS
jgi:proteasome lid subunit RPN8/RPN11